MSDRTATSEVGRYAATRPEERTPKTVDAEVHLDPDARSVSFKGVVADVDVYRTFEELEEPDRPEFALRAFKVGTLVLRDARTVTKADYVDKAFDRLGTEFQDALQAAVGDRGALPRILDEFFGERGRLPQELDRIFGPKGGEVYRLLNPNDRTTPLGQFINTLEERFDPTREGSFLFDVKKAIENGLEEIKTGLRIQEAVAEERERGTGKGRDFQEVAADVLDRIASPFGDRVEIVGEEGGPTGKKGDILIHLAARDTAGLECRIVGEAKDRDVTLVGKDSIYKELDAGMENRDARFAVAVVETEHAERFAPFEYRHPNYLLVALDREGRETLPLQVAYRLARALVCAQAGRREVGLDFGSIEARLGKIRGELEKVRAMKSSLSGATKNIDQVHEMLDQLRDSILRIVGELEVEIRKQAEADGDGGRR